MSSENGSVDVEAKSIRLPNKIPYFRIVFDQGAITQDVLNHKYPGAGTEEDPYLVDWLADDPRDPMQWRDRTKWAMTMSAAFTTLAVALVSSAYTGGIEEMIAYFRVSDEVITLGLSFFVLGFAVGPLIWAPLSELYGRQILFFITYGALTAFNAGAAGSKNIQTLLILRFFAGAFGSSPLTNSGGVLADIWPAKQRGLAMSMFAAAPFLGPTLGPVIGGFLGMNAGWRWVEGFLAAFAGALWIFGTFTLPETYAPVLFKKRAERLSQLTGKVYISKLEKAHGKKKLTHVMKVSLSRPWILLFREPIVLLLSIYMAIVYGTLYLLFGAFPIVYQQGRGWNEGVGGLAFLGVMVGMLAAVVYSIPDNNRYARAQQRAGGIAPPEARLPPAMVGSIAIPIGMFWFAWTNDPNLPFMASIAAGVPFGFGMVLVFLSIMNYLIDSYTIFAASVLAANSVIRSIFGAVFPLFTTQMFANLGIHWASCIPAFLALICVPFPFLFYKYGPPIRRNCKYAAEAEEFMRKMMAGRAAAMRAAEEEKEAGDKAPSPAPEPAAQPGAMEKDLAPADADDDEAANGPTFAPITHTHSDDDTMNDGPERAFALEREGTRDEAAEEDAAWMEVASRTQSRRSEREAERRARSASRASRASRESGREGLGERLMKVVSGKRREGE